MWGNVFSERPEAVKCSNFLGGHFVFLKCCEFCTEACNAAGINGSYSVPQYRSVRCAIIVDTIGEGMITSIRAVFSLCFSA